MDFIITLQLERGLDRNRVVLSRVRIIKVFAVGWREGYTILHLTVVFSKGVKGRECVSTYIYNLYGNRWGT